MPTPAIRPPTHTNSTNRRDWRYYGLALGVLCMLAVPAAAQTCTPSKSCMPVPFDLSAYYGNQDITINQCIDPNSPSCAWADTVMADNVDDAEKLFLACQLQPGSSPPPIALCYYSGQPGPTKYTPSCTFSQNGNAAECNCYEINANTPGATGQYSYSYVELTSILNQDLYNQTVQDCVASDGTITCLTLYDVRNQISAPQAPHLCTALTSQPNGIFPGADLISDFSDIGSNTGNTKIPPPLKDPHSCAGNPYAGCMTAPCKHTGKTDPATGLPLASCTCPTYNGPNQVGNPQIEGPPAQACTPNGPVPNSSSPSWVWSSANSIVPPPAAKTPAHDK